MSLSSNIRKAHNYMKKNGVKSTVFASIERLQQDKVPYEFIPLSEEERKKQSAETFEHRTRFSIVVPMYETNEIYAKEMIDSVLGQTYPNFELVLTDASSTDKVEKLVRTYSDARIVYIRLTQNKGISENTNAGIRMCSGQYIGLLDHDDLLTCDALYEMARFLEKAYKEHTEYAFIYSDEDKCDTFAQKYYEPNRKPKFNLDLLLSNNYICHFCVMEAELMKKLMLRSEYDGAQDHDLVLRASFESDKHIGNINKVLYHWRCHEESTASNPESKLYAYEAGRKAVADYLKNRNINAAVLPTKHNGFFRVYYGAISGVCGEVNGTTTEVSVQDIFKSRFDIGIVGGPLVHHNKITGGIIDKTKTCPIEGANIEYSGYMHRNAMQQNVSAVDIRNMYIRTELAEIVEKTLRKNKVEDMLNCDLASHKGAYIHITDLINDHEFLDREYLDVSYAICKKARMEGYNILYDPMLIRKR